MDIKTPVTITMSIEEWTLLLNCLSTAPFNLVNQIAPVVNSLQQQAAPAVEAAAVAASASGESDIAVE